MLALLATDHAWREPVHYTELPAPRPRPALFRHRPTAFACKWQEMQRSAATGEPLPHEPLAFRTSLLETTAAPFDCPVPDGP